MYSAGLFAQPGVLVNCSLGTSGSRLGWSMFLLCSLCTTVSRHLRVQLATDQHGHCPGWLGMMIEINMRLRPREQRPQKGTSCGLMIVGVRRGWSYLRNSASGRGTSTCRGKRQHGIRMQHGILLARGDMSGIQQRQDHQAWPFRGSQNDILG